MLSLIAVPGACRLVLNGPSPVSVLPSSTRPPSEPMGARPDLGHAIEARHFHATRILAPRFSAIHTASRTAVDRAALLAVPQSRFKLARDGSATDMGDSGVDGRGAAPRGGFAGLAAGGAGKTSPDPEAGTDMAAVTVRFATPHDAGALERLAALDSGWIPVGAALVAEVDGEAVAALPLGDGRALADPFRRRADLVRLLELRQSHLRGANPSRRWPPLLRRLRHRRTARPARLGPSTGDSRAMKQLARMESGDRRPPRLGPGRPFAPRSWHERSFWSAARETCSSTA